MILTFLQTDGNGTRIENHTLIRKHLIFIVMATSRTAKQIVSAAISVDDMGWGKGGGGKVSKATTLTAIKKEPKGRTTHCEEPEGEAKSKKPLKAEIAAENAELRHEIAVLRAQVAEAELQNNIQTMRATRVLNEATDAPFVTMSILHLLLQNRGYFSDKADDTPELKSQRQEETKKRVLKQILRNKEVGIEGNLMADQKLVQEMSDIYLELKELSLQNL